MKLLRSFTALVKFINQTPVVSQKIEEPMKRSARHAKRQLRKQQQGARLEAHLKKLSTMPSMKFKERLKKYHRDLENDLRKMEGMEKYISELLDLMEELEEPLGHERPQ